MLSVLRGEVVGVGGAVGPGGVMVEVAVAGGNGAPGSAAGAVDGSDVFDHLCGRAIPGRDGDGASSGGVREQGVPDGSRGGDDLARVSGAEVSVTGELAGLVVETEGGFEGNDDDGFAGRGR